MPRQCHKSPFSLFLVLVFSTFGYIIYSKNAIHGGYTPWTSWSVCSKTCGEGLRGRSRTCTAPRPGIIGKDCEGPSYMTGKCYIVDHCPIDGGYTEWSSYGACDKACGGGVKVRTRKCANPSPQYGGKSCEGSSIEKMDCNVQPCPVNGGYSSWGAFSKCEITGNKNCGKGKHVRRRTCNNPVPQHGGKVCEGADSETAECKIPCPTTPPLSTKSKSLNTTSKSAPTTVKAS